MTDEQKAQVIAEIAQEAEALEPNDDNGLLALYFKAVNAGLLRFGDEVSWIAIGNPTSFDVHPEVFKRLSQQEQTQ